MASLKYEKPVARDLGNVLLNANGKCGAAGNSFVGGAGNCKNGTMPGANNNCNSGKAATSGKCRATGGIPG